MLRWVRAGVVGLVLVLVWGGQVGWAAAGESVAVRIEVDDRLVDLSVSVEGPVWWDLAVTASSDVVWYDLDGPFPSGVEIDRLDDVGARRVSRDLVLVGDELWWWGWDEEDGGYVRVPFEGLRPCGPSWCWGGLPDLPLRDIAAGMPDVWYVVAGAATVNAYNLPSLPWVSRVAPIHGAPVLLDSGGWTVVSGDGSTIELLCRGGGADLNQEVCLVVDIGPPPSPVVGVEQILPSGCYPQSQGWECPDVNVVVAFADGIAVVNADGNRVDTVYEPPEGYAITALDGGACSGLWVSEAAIDRDDGAIVMIVPPWRDPGCCADGSRRDVFVADIAWVGHEGITRGCNPPANDWYCPDNPVTRGQMAAFLHRALDGIVEPTEDPIAFTDIGDSIFAADIAWLSATGITKGCNPPDNDRYCPDATVTRDQMAAFLVRALGYTGDGGGDLFVDDDDSIFEADIDKLATAGVTKGCNPPTNDRYCPTDNVTRDQMAAFLHRALS